MASMKPIAIVRRLLNLTNIPAPIAAPILPEGGDC